ncbi:MAG: TolC family protein, partial [Bacteroidota bacterium]
MKRKSYNLTSILLLILVLSGCMVGPKYQKPQMEVPETYRLNTSFADSGLVLKWWDLFDDPELKKLILIALDENKDVRIAASRVEQARALLGYTKADLYPRFGYEASASRGNLAGNQQFDDPFNHYYGAASLQWEIDFWGKYRYANAAARAELLASEYAHRAVQVAIISEVANTYYQLLDYRQRLAVTRRTL